MSRLVAFFVAVLGAALGVSACASGRPFVAEPELPSAPEAFGGTCGTVHLPDEPDLMGWDAGSRAALAMLRTRGVIAVRYHAEGCDVQLEVLPNCIGSGAYGYSPYAAADTKILRHTQDLYAELPLGAVSLGGKLAGGRALRTDYTLVGVDALPPGTTYPMADLRGAGCERATHVVSRVYLGGFAMVAGAERTIAASGKVFGVAVGPRAGAHDDLFAERIVTEGVAEACARAQVEGRENAQCAVPLRVGLLPIVGHAGGCPAGTSLEGKDCVRRKVLTEITCPPGTSLVSGRCEGVVSRACPGGTRFEAGAGCVAEVAPPPPPPRPSSALPPVFYMTRGSSSGLAWKNSNLAGLVETFGPGLRLCVLDQHLDDEWSVRVNVTFDAEGSRLVSVRVRHRGLDAEQTLVGDALVSCGGLLASWPWPMPDPTALGPGENASAELEAGMRFEPAVKPKAARR
jgi:hypothetical protein